MEPYLDKLLPKRFFCDRILSRTGAPRSKRFGGSQMNEMNIAKNIASLRKAKGITQEQLAQALNISSQAISKWETKTSQPDVQTLPLIAEYFHVSIDYLYYGKDMAYDDIYEKNLQKTASYPQMSKESYEEALKLFASAHHGISHGNIRGESVLSPIPAHISNEGGVSLLYGKGYGSIVTRSFFECISADTVRFSVPFLKTLSDETCLRIVMAVVSMSEISYFELLERLGIEEEELKRGLKLLTDNSFLFAKESKHKSLGTTYTVNDMYHSCICILLATLEVARTGLDDITCCMGYGDFPIEIG